MIVALPLTCPKLMSTVAYSYARISTKKQERGSGIQRQIRQSREYAERHGLALDETLHDIGVSAFTGANLKKGALGRFLNMVEQGEIAQGSVLLVESLDRISRDKIRLALPTFLEIINSGISIVTLADRETIYDASSIDQNQMLLMGSLMILSRANEESATKSHRVRSWWKQEIAKARITPGYKVKGQNPPGWFNDDWSRNEPTIATVQKIFELAADGVGQQAIARHLNSTSAPVLAARKRRGGGWYQSTIGGLLQDRRVLGEWQPTISGSNGSKPDGPPISDYMEQIVSTDLFQRATFARRPLNREKVSTNKGKVTNLFTGQVRCNCCLWSMTLAPNGTLKSRKTVLYYLSCSNRRRKVKSCVARHIFNYGWLEETILQQLPTLPWSKILKTAVPDDKLEANRRSVEEKNNEIVEIDRQLGHLVTAITNAGDIPILVKAISEKTEARNRIEEQLRVLAFAQADLLRKRDQTADEVTSSISRYIEMNDIDPEKKYEARVRLSAAMKKAIRGIFLDGEAKMAQVWISENYRLEWKADQQKPFVFHRFWLDDPILPEDVSTVELEDRMQRMSSSASSDPSDELPHFPSHISA